MIRFIERALLVFVIIAAPIRADQPAKPNIVFILADDLGWGDLGCYGQRRIKTPHLDQLSKNGTRFTQAYAGSTVCAPSRCCLMTGLHTGHARVRGNGRLAIATLKANDVTIAKILQQAGYRTAVIGKWGLGQLERGGAAGLPSKQGFDESYGFLNHGHAHNYYPSHLYRNEVRENLVNVVSDEKPNGAGVSTNKAEYAGDKIADEALAFVRRNRERPFFLYWTPTMPHANNEAKNAGMEVPDLGEYAALDIPAPAKGHAAMITRLDRDVGRLLALLAETGLDRNTYVFFTSDNGPHKEGGYHWDMNDSNGPFRGGKRDLYEGGIRVPMLVRGPGVPAGRVVASPWAFWDVLPTLAELGGAAAPHTIDGRSVAPLLHGTTAPAHAPMYWEFHEGGFAQAVRWENWKAVRVMGHATEIYDLARDEGETRNLAPDRADLVRRAEEIMRTSRTDTPDWKPTAKK